jgi:hypothetical protein
MLNVELAIPGPAFNSTLNIFQFNIQHSSFSSPQRNDSFKPQRPTPQPARFSRSPLAANRSP